MIQLKLHLHLNMKFKFNRMVRKLYTFLLQIIHDYKSINNGNYCSGVLDFKSGTW